MNQFLEQASFAISRPDLVLRKIRGKDLVEIELHEIAPYLTDSPVILEAGAFDGTDTIKFAQRWPEATIYAFEPVLELFTKAELRTRHLVRVQRYQMALSEHSG